MMVMRDVNARLPSKNSPVGPGLCGFCRLSICVPRAKGEKKERGREREKKNSAHSNVWKKVNVKTCSDSFNDGAGKHSGAEWRRAAILSRSLLFVFVRLCTRAALCASAVPWANGREKQREEHKVALAD